MTTIIDIDLESDLSEFTSTVTDGGDLSWSADAALAGSSGGMACLIDDTTAIYGEYNLGTSNTSGISRFRVYFDPNSSSPSGAFVLIVQAIRSDTDNLLWLRYSNSGANYDLYLTLYLDGGSETIGYTTVTDAPHYIEILFTRASTNVSADGTCAWWVDGTQIGTTRDDLDNYDQFVNFDAIRLGAISGLASASGTFYLDELVVNDDGSEIGAVSAGPTYTLTASGAALTRSGGSASLIASRKLTASGAGLTITGGTATPKVARKLTASGAVLTVTGGAANLIAARLLALAGGSVTITGGDATLTYTPLSGPTYTLTAGAGALSISAGAALLIASRLLAASGAAIILRGGAATLTKRGVYSVEGRIYAIVLELRTHAIEAESRTNTIAAESRTLTVDAE